MILSVEHNKSIDIEEIVFKFAKSAEYYCGICKTTPVGHIGIQVYLRVNITENLSRSKTSKYIGEVVAHSKRCRLLLTWQRGIGGRRATGIRAGFLPRDTGPVSGQILSEQFVRHPCNLAFLTETPNEIALRKYIRRVPRADIHWTPTT